MRAAGKGSGSGTGSGRWRELESGAERPGRAKSGWELRDIAGSSEELENEGGEFE